MPTPAKRFEGYLKSKKIKLSHAERSMGVSNGLLSKIFKTGKGLSTETLEAILKTYPEITFEWLTTGKRNIDLETNEKSKIKYNLDQSTMEKIIQAFTRSLDETCKTSLYLQRKLDEADAVIHNYVRTVTSSQPSSKAHSG